MSGHASDRPSQPTLSGGSAAADQIVHAARILTMDSDAPVVEAMALSGEHIAAVGTRAEMDALRGPSTTVLDLADATLMPGLIDAHAHLDREALKSLLPSVSGCQSIAELVDRLARLAARTPSGEWIVTMPLGEPPEYKVHTSAPAYAEGRLPDRHDLDRACPHHPVYIRCPWGYWNDDLPLMSIANSRALSIAGVRRGTISPSPRLRIETDAQGEPTGRFFEDTAQPLAEFTFFRCAPNFTLDDRRRSLRASMQAYNAAGTTSIFEGHGVSDEVIQAYQQLRRHKQQTVRAHLVFSPGWSGASDDDVAKWVRTQGRRLSADVHHDDWLTLSGLFAQVDAQPQDSRLRAACAPTTGWAGFNYDCGLPPDQLERLLHAAAREGLRVCAIQHRMADLFIKVGQSTPIDGLRWIVGHPSVLTALQIQGLRDHGIGVTALTSWYHWRKAASTLAEVGESAQESISPLRSLLAAGVPVGLASDNFPVSLWPAIWQAMARTDRHTGLVVSPGQCLSVEQALQCVTVHPAWICQAEHVLGTLTAGKLADFIVLERDPHQLRAADLAAIQPIATYVGGQPVWAHSGSTVRDQSPA